MSPSTYDTLLKMLTPGLTKKNTNMRRCICAEARLLLTLRYLALGDGFRSLCQQFRIAPSTCRMIVRETCKVIYRTMQPRYMATPQSEHQWKQIAEEFSKRWGFPHTIGCVDGKHIRMEKPPKTGTFFYNYKGYFSIVLMAICDADYKFLYVDVGAEGKASDGGIWRNCSFAQHLHDPTNPLGIPMPDKIGSMDTPTPYFLLGDEAFRLDPTLMKPYPSYSANGKQKVFNYRLSRSRRIVENAFGILACRFRILRRCIEVWPEFVEDIILACCTLHNFLRIHGRAQYICPSVADRELPEGDVLPGAWREEVTLEPLRRDTQKNPSQYAKEIRNRLCDYFLTREGELPWQYDKAGL